MNCLRGFRHASVTKSKASTASASTSQANHPVPSSGSKLIFDCQLRRFGSIDLGNGTHELSKISAIVRGTIKGVKPRIHRRLGQSHSSGLRSIRKNDFVPLNRGNLVIETCNCTAAEKCARSFRGAKD